MKMPPARTTSFIAAATVASWLLLSLSGLDLSADMIGGFVPARVSGFEQPGALPVWITPLTATLLHGGWLHLGFNMLMLVYCGRMVEAALGSAGLAVLYVVGAYAAALGQYVPNQLDISPMIGASGAISAVFGAYALLFGRPRGFATHPKIGMAVNVFWLAAAWIGLQILTGFAISRSGMAIAIAAHIGGFLAGLALARPLLLFRYRKA
ncbi:MAG: rhomboid family intrarane serine protease [Rhizorhabdus sp.]|nr:rhomboid family intrarane serine protease [Rhizorhabdus sp.]